jgi:hypothetical protein
MFVHEFALLIAVCTPIAVLFSMHAGLWAAGERDTLVFPLPRSYPPAIRWEAIEETPRFTPRNDDQYQLAA